MFKMRKGLVSITDSKASRYGLEGHGHYLKKKSLCRIIIFVILVAQITSEMLYIYSTSNNWKLGECVRRSIEFTGGRHAKS